MLQTEDMLMVAVVLFLFAAAANDGRSPCMAKPAPARPRLFSRADPAVNPSMQRGVRRGHGKM